MSDREFRCQWSRYLGQPAISSNFQTEASWSVETVIGATNFSDDVGCFPVPACNGIQFEGGVEAQPIFAKDCEACRRNRRAGVSSFQTAKMYGLRDDVDERERPAWVTRKFYGPRTTEQESRLESSRPGETKDQPYQGNTSAGSAININEDSDDASDEDEDAWLREPIVATAWEKAGSLLTSAALSRNEAGHRREQRRRAHRDRLPAELQRDMELADIIGFGPMGGFGGFPGYFEPEDDSSEEERGGADARTSPTPASNELLCPLGLLLSQYRKPRAHSGGHEVRIPMETILKMLPLLDRHCWPTTAPAAVVPPTAEEPASRAPLRSEVLSGAKEEVLSGAKEEEALDEVLAFDREFVNKPLWEKVVPTLAASQTQFRLKMGGDHWCCETRLLMPALVAAVAKRIPVSTVRFLWDYANSEIQTLTGWHKLARYETVEHDDDWGALSGIFSTSFNDGPLGDWAGSGRLGGSWLSFSGLDSKGPASSQNKFVNGETRYWVDFYSHPKYDPKKDTRNVAVGSRLVKGVYLGARCRPERDPVSGLPKLSSSYELLRCARLLRDGRACLNSVTAADCHKPEELRAMAKTSPLQMAHFADYERLAAKLEGQVQTSKLFAWLLSSGTNKPLLTGGASVLRPAWNGESDETGEGAEDAAAGGQGPKDVRRGEEEVLGARWCVLGKIRADGRSSPAALPSASTEAQKSVSEIAAASASSTTDPPPAPDIIYRHIVSFLFSEEELYQIQVAGTLGRAAEIVERVQNLRAFLPSARATPLLQVYKAQKANFENNFPTPPTIGEKQLAIESLFPTNDDNSDAFMLSAEQQWKRNSFPENPALFAQPASLYAYWARLNFDHCSSPFFHFEYQEYIAAARDVPITFLKNCRTARQNFSLENLRRLLDVNEGIFGKYALYSKNAMFIGNLREGGNAERSDAEAPEMIDILELDEEHGYQRKQNVAAKWEDFGKQGGRGNRAIIVGANLFESDSEAEGSDDEDRVAERLRLWEPDHVLDVNVAIRTLAQNYEAQLVKKGPSGENGAAADAPHRSDTTFLSPMEEALEAAELFATEEALKEGKYNVFVVSERYVMQELVRDVPDVLDRETCCEEETRAALAVVREIREKAAVRWLLGRDALGPATATSFRAYLEES